MNQTPKTDMLAALRMTGKGQLKEAVALLRGALPGAPMPAGPTRKITPPADIIQNALASLRDLPSALRDTAAGLGPLGGAGATGRAAPAVPSGARFETRNFSNAAGSRAYKLYIPSDYNGEALPLVVMLHGCTQSPDDFAAGTKMNELAEMQRVLVAYPAQSQSANISKCWNWFSPADQHRDQGEPSIIAGITRAVMAEFKVPPKRVYLAGLSAGGALTAIMGAEYPELYAAIGIHSGLASGAATDLQSAMAAMRNGAAQASQNPKISGLKIGVPTIVFHGDRDTTVNPLNSSQIIAGWGGKDLITSSTEGTTPGGIRYTRTVQARADGPPLLEQWVLHGVAHAWSGGSTAGSYTEPKGPDASGEMLRFFLEQR